MAGLRSDLGRKSAGSFYQAGSAGFGALSAWAPVYMSSRVSQGTLGWIGGALIGFLLWLWMKRPTETADAPAT